MEKIIQNLKDNIKIIFSALCLLILLTNPINTSKSIIILFLGGVLLLTSTMKFAFDFKLTSWSKKMANILSIILLVILSIRFRMLWISSPIVFALTDILVLSKEFITYALIILLFFSSVKFVKQIMYYVFYAINSCLEERMTTKNIKSIIKNISTNCLFLISGLCYFLYELKLDAKYYICILVSMFFLTLVTSQIKDIKQFIRKSKKNIKIVSALSTLGVCLYGQNSLYIVLNEIVSTKFSIAISIICACVSSFFIYSIMIFIWNTIFKILNFKELFKDITRIEKVIYVSLFLICISFVIVVFNMTDGFYGTDYRYDFIYTSDSPSLIRDNAYLSHTYLENDIRQPLFAIFSSPFMGITHLFGKIFLLNNTNQAILMNFVQIILLFLSNYLLARMMNLKAKNRICFITLITFTYTNLLSILMMEQYIISYFWLMLFLYSKIRLKDTNEVALFASGGTMLTNFAVVPFISKNNFKNIKLWLVDMISYIFMFIILLLALGRYDVILNLNSNIDKLSWFTGEKVLFIDRVYQYFNFIHNIFIKPSAGIGVSIFGDVSWQLKPATFLNIFGLLILILAFVSAFINKKNKASLVAFGWIILSIIMLLVFGWGTRENGLILYVLYFGWAFFILLFNLIENMDSRLKNKYFIPICTIVLLAILLSFNIPSMVEMIKFSIERFPI